MKKYIASYQNKKDECWDLIINADNHKKARRIARESQSELGKLYSVRLYKETN